SRRASVLYNFQQTTNGFAAPLTPAQLQRLKRHPSVASVRRSRVFRKLTTASPTFLGLPSTVWPAVGGRSKAGAGTVIAIIDTGVWPEHPSVQRGGLCNVAPRGVGGQVPDRARTSRHRRAATSSSARGTSRRASRARMRPDLTYDWLSPRDAAGHGNLVCGSSSRQLRRDARQRGQG
ncbi:hypothetical protein CLOP_g18217, partial [Closterium sp. NIES-67]